jgi:uroporphyrinogen III methyltransferase / synthase
VKIGKVYLVGAGPGDPGLITQKGIDCLKRAEVVIYDRLIDMRLLEIAPEKAEKIYVGKTPGQPGLKQAGINRLIVNKAEENKQVVRLKGGDPFLFGRGGEEALALRAKGIPFEIIPGISSAIAVPAYAGIPVTHRGIASSFQVIAGHKDDNKEISDAEWKKISCNSDTLIFLMGMDNIDEIAKKLIIFGKTPVTPVAVIGNGTRPDQVTVVGSLSDIARKVHKSRISSPAVIIIGEVVNLRGELSWYDNRPLSGKRVLVTRAKHQAGVFCNLLEEKGAQPFLLPVIQIETAIDKRTLDEAIANLSNYHWLLFTSENGVAIFFDYLAGNNLDIRILGEIKVGVIGPVTAKAVRNRGIIPDFIPVEYTGRGMISGLRKLNISGQRFLILRADIADDELSKGIQKYGGNVHIIPIYQTLPVKTGSTHKNVLDCVKNVDVITFTSASTVIGLMKMISDKIHLIRYCKIACIGPKTAQAAEKAGLHVDIIAKKHTILGLLTAIENYYAKEN